MISEKAILRQRRENRFFLGITNDDAVDGVEAPETVAEKLSETLTAFEIPQRKGISQT